MLRLFCSGKNKTNDSAVHKHIRGQGKEPVDTEDDKPFSREGIASLIKSLILKSLLWRMD